MIIFPCRFLDIAKIKSLLTMVGGRIVYAAGPFSDLDATRR